MDVADENNVELVIKENEDKIVDENNDELAIKEKKSSRAERRRRNRSNTTTQQIVTEEIKRMSCLRSIGCNGFLFLFSILFIAIAEFAVFYLYANPIGNATPFARIGTPYIWVYLCSPFYFFYVLYTFLYFGIKIRKTE